MPLAGFRLVKDLGAQNVRWHQIGRELHAPRIEPQHRAQRVDELCLGKARQADQQPMAAGKDGSEHLLDHRLLSEDH